MCKICIKVYPEHGFTNHLNHGQQNINKEDNNDDCKESKKSSTGAATALMAGKNCNGMCKR